MFSGRKKVCKFNLKILVLENLRFICPQSLAGLSVDNLQRIINIICTHSLKNHLMAKQVHHASILFCDL